MNKLHITLQQPQRSPSCLQYSAALFVNLKQLAGIVNSFGCIVGQGTAMESTHREGVDNAVVTNDTIKHWSVSPPGGLYMLHIMKSTWEPQTERTHTHTIQGLVH